MKTPRWSLPGPGRRIAVASLLSVAIAAGALPSSAQEETTSTTVPSSSTETPSSEPPASSETTAPPATAPATTSAADLERKREAAGELNAAKAADSEIASGLLVINQSVQETQSKIDDARKQLEAAQETQADAAETLEQAAVELEAIEEKLLVQVVEGFKAGTGDPGVFFSASGPTQAIRQNELLAQTTETAPDLIEDYLRTLEDSRIAQAEGAQAEIDAQRLEAELADELLVLQEQQGVQIRLKLEAEARISKWESELSAYAAEDDAIKALIADSSPEDVPVTLPGEPSALGFQWPIDGPVTSPYGYRIHPVYGTRKLHSGLDIGSPRGTPIAATSGGVVIFRGVRGGYGNTVIVDHGGGITSLYAHMTSFNVADGATVGRGDVVGFVGATGTATGNHLHFEIRLDGTATNPRPYLP